MSKKSKLRWWILAGVVLVATNNIVQFVQNVKSADPVVYGTLIGISAFTLRDVNIGGAFK